MHWQKRITSALICVVSGCLSAQPAPRIKYATPENISPANGPEMFRAYCSVCHGTGGLGDGPAASALKKRPADLTQLTRKNNGSFPVYRVANVIMGADVSTSHGSRDMPVWGSVFRNLRPDTVKLRIDNLTSFIESLQRQ
jgi:mono/diheme cytochrome c family protein